MEKPLEKRGSYGLKCGVTVNKMKLKKTTGYTKEEMLEIAKSYSPPILEVDVIERDELFDLNLIYDEKQQIHSFISKNVYPADIDPIDEEKILEKIRHKVEDEIKTTILNYCLDLVDKIIEEFRLDELLKDRYKDKNTIYKVKRRVYLNEHGNVNIDLYYFERLLLHRSLSMNIKMKSLSIFTVVVRDLNSSYWRRTS